MMKVGIIRCKQTEDYCPGTADFMAIRNKRGSFADLDGEFMPLKQQRSTSMPNK